MRALNCCICFLIIVIGPCIQLTLSGIAYDANKDELIFAHVIYRHGNRTPNAHFETDPYIGPIYWPEGDNSLTNVGKRTQYKLGKYLRRRYDKLIGPGYSEDKVYIRSTDVDRAIMSALCNAAGLFSPSDEQIWKQDMEWQPVPIHTIPLDEDNLVYQANTCERSTQLTDEYFDRPEIIQKYYGLMKYLEKKSGSKMQNPIDVHVVFDPIYIEHFRGLPLPEWAVEILQTAYTEYENISVSYWKSMISTTRTRKAIIGFMIKEILERFKQKTMSQLIPDRTLWIYSAHDNTIINVLTALNINTMRIPPFAASVHLELYRSREDYYVQLFYRTDNSEYIPPIEIPNCGVKCSLDEMFELYQDILPSENDTFASLCQ